MEISRDPSGITLRPHPFEKGDIIYYHLRDKQGRIHQYRHISLDFNFNGEIFIPTKASDTDILLASAKAYLNALNRHLSTTCPPPLSSFHPFRLTIK